MRIEILEQALAMAKGDLEMDRSNENRERVILIEEELIKARFLARH